MSKGRGTESMGVGDGPDNRESGGLNSAAIDREQAALHLRRVVDGAPIVLWAIDTDGIFTLSVGAALAGLGLKPGQVVGQSAFELYAAVPGILEDLHRGLKGEEFESVNEAADRVFDSRYSPLRAPDGKVTGLLGVSTDITERHMAEQEKQRMQEQLLQAQKLESVGLLASGIAHDFNNLLMSMLGNVSLVRSKLGSTNPVDDHMEMIEVAAKRATELTRQLLAYAGRSPLTQQAVDLNSLVRETHDLLLTAVKQNATVNLDLMSQLPPVRGDRAQLQQVLMNLITNATEAIEHDHGRIDIRTRLLTMPSDEMADTLIGTDTPPGSYVAVEVDDNGRGMDDDTSQRMFDPFFSTKSAGSGLGLAALQGIVRSHSGVLAVDSSPGVGTKIRVLLPSTEHEDTLPDESASNTIPEIPHGTILVVDDQALVRYTVVSLLRFAGCKVLEASSGREALSMVEEHGDAIGGILLDMRMPGMNGQETLFALQKIAPHLRVVMTSGHGAEGAIAQLVAEGAVGYLHKPYSESELLEQFGLSASEHSSS
ncbi:MAG: response regulator [Polyangiaceae bacterium]